MAARSRRSRWSDRQMRHFVKPGALAVIVFALVASLAALDGDIAIHDPSTVVRDGGHFYVYGTGNGLPGLISDDGWTRRRAGGLMQAVPGGRPGADVIARGGNNT